ncbi:Hypothetical protein (Fragment) [Durusdinium trenchii]|uniref:Uncharacterized protein n=1 Tax=Durusdinium trenchii TaxID=1381693 RepID=A0ABP0QGM2_9DINO
MASPWVPARMRKVACWRHARLAAAHRALATQLKPAKAAKAKVAPRWPFLRSKSLTLELQKFAGDVQRELWVTGARGSGAGTAIQAALPNALILDMEQGENAMQAMLRERLPEFMENKEDLVESCIAGAFEQFPKAGTSLLATVEALVGRMGLPHALPSGTEVPQSREILEKHRTDPVSLAVHVCTLLAGSPRLQLPPRRLTVALALLSEVGRREGGASSALDFLLAAAGDRLSGPLVLLRAHATPGLLERARGKSGPRSPRLLVQSYDGIGALRASEAGVPVLTADEWSQDMAKAIFQRFLPEEEADDWRAVWTCVGGHAAHLRRVAELIVEERRLIEAERLREEQEEERDELRRQKLRPGRNPDAEEFLEIAKKTIRDDSFRADARTPQTAAEQLLRRLPEVFVGESWMRRCWFQRTTDNEFVSVREPQSTQCECVCLP